LLIGIYDADSSAKIAAMFIKLKPSSNQFCLLIVCAFAATLFALNSCRNSAEDKAANDIEEGKQLATKYCTSCHQLPDPSLIDRKNWERKVLPAMAKQLRLQYFMGQYFADRQSFISTPEWQKIVAYYRSASPDSLIIPKHAVAPVKDWAIFSVIRPAKKDTTGLPAMTTFIGFDPQNHKIYNGDAANNLFEWDSNLKPKLIKKFQSPVTGIIFPDSASKTNTGIVTTIGILPPLDIAKGKVVQMDLDGKSKDTVLIGENLPRAVQTVAADFNKDGLVDYVVCGFGHKDGGLYLLQQQANHQFKKITIRDVAGGEQLITGDFNHDGWTDVMCLFAQGDEGVWMFLNDHKGGFTTQNLLHFQPVYGSSSFQLVDINHDGKPDILYTSGDNSDFSLVLKPYHGIYIFTNQGNWKFKQTYFYQANGCTKAIAADFDHDGDMDIAAISFFPDLKYHPEEGFLYLEQTSPGQFKAHEVPVNKFGRWLTMDVADIDHDGKPDIILGNFSNTGRGFVNQHGILPNWDKHEPIIVLKNISKR
jgi:hypothetical protein